MSAAESRTRSSGKTQRYWRCRCDCGVELEATTGNLRYGNTKSCGCLRREPAHNRKDLIGTVFGALTAISSAPSRQQYGTTVSYWQCRCECGRDVVVPTGNLLSGNTKSCGCLVAQSLLGNRRAETHGYAQTATWESWQAMHRRVSQNRPRYGGRGITIDPRWDTFENFIADMGERPEGHTIDRIDNDGNYSPENCRWATGLTQGNNRGNNRHLTHRGRTQTMAEWAREAGLPNGVFYNRVMALGWSVERALTEPVQRRRQSS
ncbi:hypothetical protein ACFWPK_22490 [Nocardia sp. NPDC058519]|uniref:hypothetical protein n=1 Tax=Nocardia sp. NPDC058519 TaxID=3346535 RepID=UPI0036571C32